MTFLVHTRTELADRIDGGQPVGTVFSAIVAKSNLSDTVEVQRSSLRGINVLVNGKRLLLDKLRVWQYKGVSITYEENSIVSLYFSSGESIRVQVQNNIFMIELSASLIHYWNQTRGLLGNWNGNLNDDFLRPSGAILSAVNATMEDIHHLFGEECEC